MRVFVLALGTRGDVAPLFLLARSLEERGHEVVFGTSAFYNGLTGATPIRLVAVGNGTFEAMTQAMCEIATIPEKSGRDMAFVNRWMLPQIEQSRELIDSCLCASDYGISNVPTVWRRPNSDAIMPGAFVSYEPPDPPGRLPFIGRGEVLSLIAVSPLLLDAQGTLGLDRRVTGFWRAEQASSHADGKLQAFLAAGQPPVVLSLGSMAVFEDQSLAGEFLQALQVTNNRGVLISGWGTPTLPDDAGDRLLIVNEADYDGLLPRSSLVIHHGGSGTVAAVLLAGVPCLLRTSIGSQQRYAELLQRHGLCAGLLQGHPLRALELAGAMSRALEDPSARPTAAKWRRALALEPNGLDKAADLIEMHGRFLAGTSLRALAVPSSTESPQQSSLTNEPAPALSAMGVKAEPDPPSRASNVAPATAISQGELDALRAKLIQPSQVDVARFHAANPNLFAGRQIFTLQRIGLPAHAMNEAATSVALKTALNANVWIRWLEDQGIPFKSETIQCPGDEVPGDLLHKLAKLTPGQWLQVDEPQRATILVLLACQPAPRSLGESSADIVKFLQNMQLGQLIRARAESTVIRS